MSAAYPRAARPAAPRQGDFDRARDVVKVNEIGRRLRPTEDELEHAGTGLGWQLALLAILAVTGTAAVVLVLAGIAGVAL
jgi:hypothetical protein